MQLQADCLTVDARSSAVRALDGQPQRVQEQFDHVSQSRRQPGLIFKPAFAAAAFTRGISPEDVMGNQTAVIKTPGSGVRAPSDETPPSVQPMTLHDRLGELKNTITAQPKQQVGPANVA